LLRKAELCLSIKDYRRIKSLKVTLLWVPYAQRQFLERMDGKPDFRMCDERSALTPDPSPPGEGNRPVSVTRVMTALRKALAQAV
jgi:hypothetical protein